MLKYLLVAIALAACGNAPPVYTVTFFDQCTGTTKRGVFVQTIGENNRPMLVSHNDQMFMLFPGGGSLQFGLPDEKMTPLEFKAACPKL